MYCLFLFLLSNARLREEIEGHLLLLLPVGTKDVASGLLTVECFEIPSSGFECPMDPEEREGLTGCCSLSVL